MDGMITELQKDVLVRTGSRFVKQYSSNHDHQLKRISYYIKRILISNHTILFFEVTII